MLKEIRRVRNDKRGRHGIQTQLALIPTPSVTLTLNRNPNLSPNRNPTPQKHTQQGTNEAGELTPHTDERAHSVERRRNHSQNKTAKQDTRAMSECMSEAVDEAVGS